MTNVDLPVSDDATAVAGPKVLLTDAACRNRQAKVISLPGDLPPRDSDAFLLRAAEDTLVIAGGRGRAVLYGVYAFLERVGCRWFGPGEEYVPRLETLEIPAITASEAPAFEWRGLELIAGSNPAVVDWMGKARLNVAWPERYSPSDDLTVNDTLMESTAVPEMIERGMTIFWGGHILPILLSPERYAGHPEFFARIKGKRLDPAAKPEDRSQPCTSNPEAMRILTENTIAFLRNHPWIDVLFVWGNDTVQWCECDSCRALEPDPSKPSAFGGSNRSATYCRMIKILNEGVRRALPGRRIAFNHYYNLESIPSDREGNVLTSVLPDGSVLSAVDAYRQCDRHAFSDPGCPKGKRIGPIARMWGPHYEDTISWSYYWSWNFMKGLPISMAHKIPQDFRLISSLGIRGVVDNVSLAPANLHWLNNRINFYIYGQAAWDPDVDVDAVLADFFKHYYGPAEEPMAAFWRLIERATTKFGADPAFMPETPTLAAPAVVHGWMMDINYLIPNRAVLDPATRLLRDALSHVTTATGEPLKAEYTPYVFRLRALESAIATWGRDDRAYAVFGFFNGGGQGSDHLYRSDGTIEGRISCTVVSGNNRGDCFWTKPLATEQLAHVGDHAQVDVRINIGPDVVGEPIYRSGPGLYHAHDQTSPCGATGAHSLMLFISNLDNDESGARQVIALECAGRFQTSVTSSADNAWDYGRDITLRTDYVSDAEGRHTYRYSYDAGEGWVEVGRATFSVKLPFVAPMHKWGGAVGGTRTHYPVLDWAEFAKFNAGPARAQE